MHPKNFVKKNQNSLRQPLKKTSSAHININVFVVGQLHCLLMYVHISLNVHYVWTQARTYWLLIFIVFSVADFCLSSAHYILPVWFVCADGVAAMCVHPLTIISKELTLLLGGRRGGGGFEL